MKALYELIHDIENYLEGRSEWFEAATLSVDNKEDWEFQENILIAENIAITRGTDVTDWVLLMVSKESFADYIRLESRVRVGDEGHGIGFLLGIPEEAERKLPNDGFCIWLASDKDRNSKLVYCTVEVLRAPEICLKRGRWYDVRIEMFDHNIYCYIDDQLQFSYISHLPLIGTHVGILTRDADFTVEPIRVSIGGQNVQVSCLAIPDAFLAHKDYPKALSEYRRIGYAFSGRQEGRDAMFRAGVTLLEKAKNSPDPERTQQLYDEALEEFGKLHGTPGAPLEYLGKGLVYHSLHDYEEEIKCYELACRRYPKHPLLPVLHEQVLYRMHESSRYHPKATYHFILLALCHLPDVVANKQADRLFQNLQAFWEKLPFITERSPDSQADSFAVQLAFWLAKAHVLLEIIEREDLSEATYRDALYCLIELGAWKLAKQKNRDTLLGIAVRAHEKPLALCYEALFELASKELTPDEARILFYLMDRSMPALIEEAAAALSDFKLTEEMQVRLDAYRISAFLWKNEWSRAGEILQKYPVEMLTQERTLLYFLYGCWLLVTEGKEISDIHFSSILHVVYPRSWTLGAHYIKGDIHDHHNWFDKAFLWDKRQLFKQLALYYHCAGDFEKVKEMKEKEDREFLPPDPFANN